MGAWIYLLDDDGPVTVKPFQYGSTQSIGGTTEAEVSVTYNYSRQYNELWGDEFPGLVRFFDGKRADDLIPKLAEAVEKLGTDRDVDYWAPTSGNAGYFMAMMLDWARQYPDATFEASG